EDQEVVDEWTKGGFDWNKLKELCPHYVALLSKDDPDVPYDENKPVFEKELSAKIITFEDKGHFTSDDGATELPQALDEVLKMSQ
ncbi:MAG TPA: hypothetical protein VFK07_01730, partial [Candidatus Paceibacterota bacterium]|nr:hypothetical protein [Candidatus Paceibacterota bacterium]